MSGQRLSTVQAQVMCWSEQYNGWIPLDGGGVSSVSLIQRPMGLRTCSLSRGRNGREQQRRIERASWSAASPSHTQGCIRASNGGNSFKWPLHPAAAAGRYEYLIYCRRHADNKVLLNCAVAKEACFRQVMPTFHHWQMGEHKFGLSFQSSYEASKFNNKLHNAIDHLHRQSKSSSGESNLDGEDLEDDVFVSVDLPLCCNGSDASSGHSENSLPVQSSLSPLPEQFSIQRLPHSATHSSAARCTKGRHRQNGKPPRQPLSPSIHIQIDATNNGSDATVMNNCGAKSPDSTPEKLIGEKQHLLTAGTPVVAETVFEAVCGTSTTKPGSDLVEHGRTSPSYVYFHKAEGVLYSHKQEGVYHYPYWKSSPPSNTKADSGHLSQTRTRSTPGLDAHLRRLQIDHRDKRRSAGSLKMPFSMQPVQLPLKKGSSDIIRREQCYYCKLYYNTSNNPPGSCAEAPDACDVWARRLSCYACAECAAFCCLRQDGEMPHDLCACAPPAKHCWRRWALLLALSIFVPCLWCYLPLRACKLCRDACPCCSVYKAKHKPVPVASSIRRSGSTDVPSRFWTTSR